MAILNKKEKKELLNLSRSKKIKKDFIRLRRRHDLSFSGTGYSIGDRYIRFLAFCDDFVNSQQKLFRKIKGNDFKI